MESLLLFMVAMLAIAVAWLFTSLRHYQRIDYSGILEQDQYVRALDDRVAYLEQLIASQQEQYVQRERELRSLLVALERQLAAEVEEQSQPAVDSAPAARSYQSALDAAAAMPLDDGLLAHPEQGCGPLLPEEERKRLVAAQRRLIPFVPTARQQTIARYLAEGHGTAEAARALSCSRHEVELVQSLMVQRNLSA